jgi:hypothetical protein
MCRVNASKYTGQDWAYTLSFLELVARRIKDGEPHIRCK